MITGETLSAVPLFTALPERERETIAARAADIHLRVDEWVLREGEAAAFHVVLLGSSSLASVRALTPTRIMRLATSDFHHLVAECPVLNAEILRTMATRVSGLQKLVVATPIADVTVTGPRQDPACHAMRDFLVRNHIGFEWIEPHASIVSNAGDWPVIRFQQDELKCPTLRTVANRVGLQTAPKLTEYDVVIAGGGPAGLAAAVYGASEGLCTLLVERVAPGGQAGTSSRIENYLGFPTGVSGDDLSLRAREQASRFGAELVVTREVSSLHRHDDGAYVVRLNDGDEVRTKSVVLSTGVQWRRLDAPGMDRLLGRGVFYGAARAEALGVRGRPVYLSGGGNSAGQAAMLFASYAEQVTLLVRGAGLAESMSQYLIDQLASKDNITIEPHCEVVGVEGDEYLEQIHVANRDTGTTTMRDCAGLFVFIGARPLTDWLPPTIIRDDWSYVCTGRDVIDLLPTTTSMHWPLERDPYLLETSSPGVFAAGDVRHGSIKRVASSVGEGSMAIAFVHQFLAEGRLPPLRR